MNNIFATLLKQVLQLEPSPSITLYIYIYTYVYISNVHIVYSIVYINGYLFSQFSQGYLSVVIWNLIGTHKLTAHVLVRLTGDIRGQMLLTFPSKGITWDTFQGMIGILKRFHFWFVKIFKSDVWHMNTINSADKFQELFFP